MSGLLVAEANMANPRELVVVYTIKCALKSIFDQCNLLLRKGVIQMSAVFNFKPEQFNTELASVITDYQAAEQFESDKWADAVRIAYNCGAKSGEEWKDYYLKAEEEQATAREMNGEFIKRTKAGKIVASQVFPKTWNTDKAIIGKALDSGVDLMDSTGDPKPKTALQEEYKEASPKSDKTAFEKITTTINTFQALYGELSQLEQDNVKAQMAIIMGLV